MSGDVEPDAAPGAEHELVVVVRRNLDQAKALDTIDGQLALRLAEQVSVAAGAALPKLVDEFRRALAAAVPGAAGGPTGPGEPDDEVTRARRAREEARRAAGLPARDEAEDPVSRARRRMREAAAKAAAEDAAAHPEDPGPGS